MWLRPQSQRHEDLFSRCHIFSDCPPLLIFRVLHLPEPEVIGHLLYQQVIIIYPWSQLQQPGEVGQIQPQDFIQHQPSCATILESLYGIGNVSPNGRKFASGWVVVVGFHRSIWHGYYHAESSLCYRCDHLVHKLKGSGNVAYPGDNTKMTFTTFLVKCRCTDDSTSVMAESNVIIASPMTSLLGIDPSVRRDYNPLLCRWSFEPAITITCGSMLTILRTLIVMPPDCPQSNLGAVKKITSGQK